MKKWKSYKPDVADKKFDAIIIGSGIGGLCTAALLSLKGKRVLVLENTLRLAAGHIPSAEIIMNGMWESIILARFIIPIHPYGVCLI